MPSQEMNVGIGGLVGGLGGAFAGSFFGDDDPTFEDMYGSYLGGMPSLRDYGGYRPVGLPGLADFGRFGSGDLDEAYRMLRPQQQLALANNRRSLASANAASGAGVAAGGLSPAAAAAMASRNALGSGMQRTALDVGFGGAGIDLAMGMSQQRLAQAQALQGARFGLFDRSFQQATYGSAFERQRAMDMFQSELARRGLAGDLAGAGYDRQQGDFWDWLQGAGTSFVGGLGQGAGAYIGSGGGGG